MRTKRTIEEMRKIAASRGGLCLSETYTNTMTKLHWQCSEGHEWWAQPNNVIHAESWCPECAGNVKKSVAEMHQVAASKNGKFLSREHRGVTVKHRWQCDQGHEFDCRPHDVLNGVWCSLCSQLLNERICRAHFEAIFRHPFPTLRPKWLINERGNRMELDGYSEELEIAFEYQGKQHYERVKHFQNEEKLFSRQINDDNRRRQLCKENGVVLIEVPYSQGLDGMRDYILNECRKLGIRKGLGNQNDEADLRDVFSPKSLQRYQALAREKGGLCLSSVYKGAHSKLLWKCAKGHSFHAPPHHVRKGGWCPECVGRKRKTLDDAKAAAIARGGRCLSTEFKNTNIPLFWECSKRHKWHAPYNRVANGGHWCSQCAGLKRKTIEQMRTLAESRGGKCLSKTYAGTKSPLQWECEFGHQWKSAPANLLNKNSWCPDCYDKRRGKQSK